VDAVSEFKPQANQLSAEYGNTGSAVVTFTLKSGTNQLRGTAFNIFRNEKLDARSFLAPNRAPLRQNEFGLTLGGPVWLPKLYNGKDKTFFFFSCDHPKHWRRIRLFGDRAEVMASGKADEVSRRIAAG
jgi:hypothetical protein